jgi:hypothetical protein
MRHIVLLFLLTITVAPIFVGQSTPVGISGLVSGPLPVVANAPMISATSCSGTATWKYQYAAVDATTGMTAGGPVGQITGACATLATTTYLTITTALIEGSASCKIYRTTSGGTPNTVGLIRTVPCGGSLNDAGLPANTEAGCTMQPYPIVNCSIGVTLSKYDLPAGRYGVFVEAVGKSGVTNWLAPTGASYTAP